MIAYKGFNEDMTCRGFQYEEGKEYEYDGDIKLCEEGFHACKHPLECFKFYDPSRSLYHVVELNGETLEDNDSTKMVASKIKIGKKLNIAELVNAAIDFAKKRTIQKDCSDEAPRSLSATENYGVSSATGDCGASSATGSYGASSATGYRGASSAGNATAIAVAWGLCGKAKGVVGSHIVLADWRYKDSDWKLTGAKLFRVDGEMVKADTWYTLKGGELAEVE